MPTSRIRRTAAPARLVLRSGAGAALARARKLAARDATARDLIDDEQLAKAATRAAEVMGGMKGAVMKIGQLLSFVDTEYVPEQYRKALSALQADAPPMPYDLVAEVVRSELGAPADKIFDWFSPEPVAAASIGQVHVARLTIDGTERELVVKVQYPGIADAIASDLANGALLAFVANLMQTVLRDLVPNVDAKAFIAEIADRVGEELDYTIEAASQQLFADLWRDEPTIHVPEVIPELSSVRVLTMEYVDAMRWSAAQSAPQHLRDAWGAAIARFVFGSLYLHHVFNADPHPGNYLFHEDGTVTFLDFGCVKRFTEEHLGPVRQLRRAATTGTADAVIDAMVAMGALRARPPASAVAELDAWARRDFSPLSAPQPFHYTRAWASETIGAMANAGFNANIQRLLTLPKDNLFLLRITAGLNSVLAGLECRVDWDELGPQVWGRRG
jgi:predicted unusual protein kinase regulating ubiquinone biosynthesis (AarF/ABC1/UbiB family)